MKVSIIIPVYKAANYIELCIKSIMDQTYQDIECFLVNDASPDDSVSIAEQFIANYNGPIQFYILNHEQNRGPAVARNTGIYRTNRHIIHRRLRGSQVDHRHAPMELLASGQHASKSVKPLPRSRNRWLGLRQKPRQTRMVHH